MPAPRYLTKSRFKLAVECPTKLYYVGKSNEYRDQMAQSDFLAMLAEGGYQVGELAKQLYPDGIEIRARDHALAESQTRELLQRERIVLFEPAIRVGNYFIRIDILVKDGNCYELIEVKAKSYDSTDPRIEAARGGISSGMLPYIQDAAFQMWVLQQAFPAAEVSVFLMMPDKARCAPVDGINQMFKIDSQGQVQVRAAPDADLKALARDLLAKVPVTSYAHRIVGNPLDIPGGAVGFSDAASVWAQAYADDQRISPVIGAHCGRCQFMTSSDDVLKSGFKECWQLAAGLSTADLANGTVLDLWNYRGKEKLVQSGIYKLSQIQREDFKAFDDEPGIDGLSDTQRQWLQVGGIPEAYDFGGFYFDAALVARHMANWRYPLHLIDFETAAVALPYFAGMRPYEAVAFQFSHHVLTEDGQVRHEGEFLSVEPGEFPNYRFVRELKRQLENDDGTVFMWSPHENTILNRIHEQLGHDPAAPEDAESLKEFIRSLVRDGRRAMVDLCHLAQRAFFHPDTKGSNSIKKVLPAVLKESEFLRATYTCPIYGAPEGIPSANFASPEGYVWLDVGADGGASDPYARLKAHAASLIPDDTGTPEERASLIAEGGAAATAYARLQFEDLDARNRSLIKAALLRYCELDTLAMVMVVQGWQDFVARRFR